VTTDRRAVFLDRDGVLNEAIVLHGIPHPPATLTDLVVSPGADGACRALKGAGFLLIMVTNQPDLARGTATSATVEAINGELQRRLGLDDVFMCPHDDADDCMCRKPRPGLLLEAASRWNVRLDASIMVGDRWRDIEAGRRAGCATVLVGSSREEKSTETPDWAAVTLGDAVPWILGVGLSLPKEDDVDDALGPPSQDLR
jgi:D-glycero-D-manno-heptose 1,7-bisphosphate phosphatase